MKLPFHFSSLAKWLEIDIRVSKCILSIWAVSNTPIIARFFLSHDPKQQVNEDSAKEKI